MYQYWIEELYLGKHWFRTYLTPKVYSRQTALAYVEDRQKEVSHPVRLGPIIGKTFN